MLSYASSSPRSRIDDDTAHTTTTPVKEGTAPVVRRSPFSMSRPMESPSYRLIPRTTAISDDGISSRTYREREEVRDDTLAQGRQAEWNHEHNRRFQTSPPSPFQDQQVSHPSSSIDNRVELPRRHVGDDAWTAAHRAAQEAIRARSWSEHRPVLHHSHTDTEIDSGYTSSYPVAQPRRRRRNDGYLMHPRSASFEQLRSPGQSRVLLHSQRTPPVRRYEDHRRRQYASLEPSERAYPSHALPPQRSVGQSVRAETEWHGQYARTHSQRVSSNRGTSSSTRMLPHHASYEQLASRWRAPPPRYETMHKQRVERNTISVADVNLAQSSSSSSLREWREQNAANGTKPTPMTIEVNPSGHSDESSSSTLGMAEEDAPTTVRRAEDNAKRTMDPSHAYPPAISEDPPQSYQPAPAKRMRPHYAYPSESATSSLELLCSATLDLGPLQENATGCSCPRSNCIKLYCDCFKAGRRCSSKCSCTNCKNTPAESGVNGERTRAIKNILARNPRAFTGGKKEGVSRKPGDLVCNCVKSRCLKLYCECFQKGKLCNDACSCVSCLNTQEENHAGGRRKLAIQQALEKRPDAFTKKPKEIGSGCACKNNR